MYTCTIHVYIMTLHVYIYVYMYNKMYTYCIHVQYMSGFYPFIDYIGIELSTETNFCKF